MKKQTLKQWFIEEFGKTEKQIKLEKGI